MKPLGLVTVTTLGMVCFSSNANELTASCHCNDKFEYSSSLISSACDAYCDNLSLADSAKPNKIKWPKRPKKPRINPFEKRSPLYDLEIYRLGNEAYRVNLESSRISLEHLREHKKIDYNNYLIEFDNYKSGIQNYRQNFGDYRDLTIEVQTLK